MGGGNGLYASGDKQDFHEDCQKALSPKCASFCGAFVASIDAKIVHNAVVTPAAVTCCQSCCQPKAADRMADEQQQHGERARRHVAAAVGGSG
uniref:Uncharacterized protein n=1 Tax=Globodera rostochiensis TaxID=31243 RepID=A0A914H1P2_GLORO